MTRDAFAAWLERYKQAWETRDPEVAAALFAADAVYEETPFAAPLAGRDAIRAYWREGAHAAQREVRFRYEVGAVGNGVGWCRWHCTFTRIPSGEQVELDGVLRCRFDESGACTHLQEWWHRRTM